MATVRKRLWTHNGIEKEAWVVAFTDERGKRRQGGTYEKKKDAEREKQRIEAEMSRGGVGDWRGMKVSKLLEEFIRYQEMRMRDGRIGRGRYRNIRISCDTLFLPYFGAMRLGDVTANDVEAFYLWLVKDRGLNPRSSKDRATDFGLMLDYAVQRGGIAINVARDAMRRLRGIKVDPIRTFTRDEVMNVLATAETRARGQWPRSHAFIRCCVHLAAFCGLRRGEIFALTPDAIDFDRRLLRIRHNLTATGELKGPKTRAGKRDIPVPPHVLDMLKDWLVRWLIPNDRDLMFVMGTKAGRTGPNIRNPHHNFYLAHWLPLLERAGIPTKVKNNLHFHALRHFCASFWIERGMPLTDAAQMLGHAKFDITLQVYAHPIVSQGRRHELIETAALHLLPAPAIIADATRAQQPVITH